MHENEKNPERPRKPLKQALFERIEREQVQPRSRLFFRSQECFVWFLWFLSVVVGSFAVAISLFVVLHRQYALYETTHDNFFTYLVDVLPYLWIVVFGLMVAGAVFNLRHTKRGYQYPIWKLILSSLVLSFAGGSALQFFGLGFTIDSILGKQMNVYTSQEKLEERLWQEPEDGRLVGRQVLTTLSPTTTVIFEDVRGGRWQMTVIDLFESDRELLGEGGQVRVLGGLTDGTGKVFHACGVFPWMMDRSVTVSDMSRERAAFVQKVYDMKHRAEERLALMEERTFASSSTERNTMGMCAELTAAKRVNANQ